MAIRSVTARRRATRSALVGAPLAAVLLAASLAGCDDQGEVTRLQARAKSLEAQLTAERKTADTRLDDALKRIAALERRAKSSDDRVAAMAIGQVGAERRDEAARATIAKLRGRIAALESTTKSLAAATAATARADADAFKDLEKKLTALDQRTVPLVKAMGSAEADVALLRTRVTTLGRQIEALLAAIAPSGNADDAQDKRIDSLAKSVGQITTLIGEIVKSTNGLADRIGPLSAESKASASRLRTLTAAMGALRTAVERVESTAATLEKRIQALEAQQKR